MSRIKDLTKNTLIITIGRISTQFITFLLLPLYTSLLSTEEYGTVDLITTLVQLIIPITSLMIDQGVFRYLLNCKDEKSIKKIVSNGLLFLIGFNMLFLILYLVIIPFLSSLYKIWIVLILIATCFSNMFLQIARGLKKTVDYAAGSFICSFVTIVLNVLCIAFIKMGAEGNVICCIFLFLKLNIYKYISIKVYDKKIILAELKYSVPLVPNQLSLWVMNSSDRLIVSIILGTAANGILAVTHKFPAIFMTFFNIFQLAWHETGAIHYFDEDRDVFFSQTIEKIITIFSTFCIGIIVCLPIVFSWFVNSAYNEAYLNIPIYLVASLFNVIVGLLGVVYVATKKTIEIAKTTFIAAAINIVVNLLFVKYLGLYAASISTFVGYLLTMIYRIVDTKKYLSIKFNIKQCIFIIIVLSGSIIIYYLKNRILSMILLPFFIIGAFILNKDIVITLVKYMKGRKRRNV